MCYANLVLARGVERVRGGRSAERGISGLIVPDLPLEEAGDVLAACDAAGVALVPLVAPTTPDERLARDRRAGARVRLHRLGHRHDRRARRAVGRRCRGILAAHAGPHRRAGRGRLRHRHARGRGRAAADAGADGVIVGSRLVRAAAEAASRPRAVRELVGRFADALR